MLKALWCAFIFSLPFTDLLFFPSVLVGAGQLSTIFAIAVFLILALRKPNTAIQRLTDNSSSKLLLLIGAVAALSSFMSVVAPISEWKGEILWIKSLKQCVQLGIAYMCFAAPLLYIDTLKRFFATVRLYALTLWISIAYGLFELLHYSGIGSAVFATIASAAHYGTFFGSAENPNLVFVPSLHGFPRLRLLASEPSMAGNYLISVLPLVFLMRRSRGGFRWTPAFLSGLVLLVLTFSLGAWIAMLIATPLGYLLLMRDKRRAPKLLIAVGACALIVAFSMFLPSNLGYLSVPVEVLARLTYSSDISVSGRSLENQTALRIAADYPLLGVGIGNWVFHYPGRMNEIASSYVYFHKQVSESGFERSSGINNLYLRFLCELGVIGVLLLAVFLFRTLRSATAIITAGSELRDVGIALMVSCLALIIHFNSLSAFDKSYWWFQFGLTAAGARICTQQLDFVRGF
jgi:O-antigen ligase